MQETQDRYRLRVRVTEFSVPPVHDALVLGRNAPIGCEAIRRALVLLSAHEFEHIELDDEIIADLIVRKAILLRLPRDRLIDFALRRLKPLLEPGEILHLDLDVEIHLEEDPL